jgi:ADP-heptose:LPS heptosyltransferase
MTSPSSLYELPEVAPADRCDSRIAAREISSIAVFRALKLGDMLCVTPALRALRRHYPKAHIALIALPWFRELSSRYGHVIDEVIEFPGSPNLPERQASRSVLDRFIGTMACRGFDLVIQMHGSGELTNPLIARFAGRQAAGFYPRSGSCPDPAGFLPWIEEQPEPLRYIELLAHLGIPSQGTWLGLPISPSEIAEARWLKDMPGIAGRPIACLHPGASLPERRWSASSFAAIGDRLAQHGFAVVLTGGPEERTLTAEVAARMRRGSVDVAGATSIGLLAALVSEAALVVCNDTGVSHVAAATRTPSVVISPVSDPRRWAPLDQDLHRLVDARQGASVDQVWQCIERLVRDLGPSGAEKPGGHHPAGQTPNALGGDYVSC